MTERAPPQRHPSAPQCGLSLSLNGARAKARERGSDKVRPRDIKAVTPARRVTPEQSAIQVFLSVWDTPRRNDAALEKAIERLRELVP